MKRILITLLFLYITGSIFAYPFTIPYFDEEFFLYPYLNYDQTTEWKKAREGRLYDGGFVQTSHGSQTTWLLMSSEEAVINQNIGEKFLFRFMYRELTSRHLSYNKKMSTVGIGYKVNKLLTVYAGTDLTSRKEEVDAGTGVLFTFQSAYAYFDITFDDLLFDIKNLGNGTSNKLPLTFNTDIRFSFNRLYFYLSGKYDTGIDREWLPGPYTDILKHRNHVRELYTRIEYDILDYLRLYQENHLNDFFDAKRYKDLSVWDPDSSSWIIYIPEISEYEFSAKMSVHKLGGIFRINEKNSVDAGLSYAATVHKFDLIDGEALTNGHATSYTIEYPAFLPYIIYKYRIHTKFTAEAAYMGSYTAEDYKNNYYYERYGEEYWDKELLKIGFEFRFSPNCSLYISAGQLINTGVFGGGNARFNLFF